MAFSSIRRTNGMSYGSTTGSGMYGVSEAGAATTRELQSSAGRAGAMTAGANNIPYEFNPGSMLNANMRGQGSIERLEDASMNYLYNTSPSYQEYLKRKPNSLDILLKRKDAGAQILSRRILDRMEAEGISYQQGRMVSEDRVAREANIERDNRRQDIMANLAIANFAEKQMAPDKPNQFTDLAINDRPKFSPESVVAYDQAKATGHPSPWSLLKPKGPDGEDALNRHMEDNLILRATPESLKNAYANRGEGGKIDLSRLQFMKTTDQAEADRLTKEEDRKNKLNSQVRNEFMRLQGDWTRLLRRLKRIL